MKKILSVLLGGALLLGPAAFAEDKKAEKEAKAEAKAAKKSSKKASDKKSTGEKAATPAPAK